MGLAPIRTTFELEGEIKERLSNDTKELKNLQNVARIERGLLYECIWKWDLEINREKNIFCQLAGVKW